MGDKNPDIITKRYIKRVLYQAGFVILALLAFGALSFSYAKYIASRESDNSAGVANVGVEVFELVKPEDDDYDWSWFKTTYSDDGIGAGYKGKAVVDYEQIVPGADIPAPYINLKINSEVSYTLYVKVKVSQNLPHYIKEVDANGYPVTEETIYCLPDDDQWTVIGDQTKKEGDCFVYTYKYIVDNTATDDSQYIFKAGTKYEEKDEYGNATAKKISILYNDLIYVSDKYGRAEFGTWNDSATPFTIEFEIFIRQTLDGK